MCSAAKSVIPGHGIILMLSMNVCFIRSGTSWGPYFPRDRLSAQRYRNLVKIVLKGCLKACPWSWSKGCGFRRMELRHIMWKMCGSLCGEIPRKVDGRGG